MARERNQHDLHGKCDCCGVKDELARLGDLMDEFNKLLFIDGDTPSVQTCLRVNGSKISIQWAWLVALTTAMVGLAKMQYDFRLEIANTEKPISQKVSDMQMIPPKRDFSLVNSPKNNVK